MANTQRLGLLGQGISFSLSPKIHLESARLLGISCEYKLYDLKAEKVGSFLKKFWNDGGLGLNVTTPHKELVAKELGASLNSVNTLYRGQVGFNTSSTDGKGFARSVARMGRELNAYANIVILGSGGASLAILNYLQASGINRNIHILRRSAQRDKVLQQELSQPISFFGFDCLSLKTCLDKVSGTPSLLIQASSAPLKGDRLDHLLPALDDFEGAFVDLVYDKPSALYHYAKDQGLNCQDGLPMLIEQARLAQELWWGKSADFNSILDHLISGDGKQS